MRHRVIMVPIILFIISFAAWAVTPQFWENFSQEDLLKGSLNHVSLTSEGKLLMAPAYDIVYDTGQPYVFSMVRDKAGNLYVGTGDEGKVFKIDPQGKGTLYFQTRELNIFAMALDSSGTLYVGTSPDGKVYKVTGPNQSTEFCNPETKYIWSMVFDESGDLYVGTGPNGIIYKIDKSGGKSVFYTGRDTHVRCLTLNNNKLLAGTSPSGLIIEISLDGKGFTIADTPLEEVHALKVDRFGVIYALASSSKSTGTAIAETPKASSADKTLVSTSTVTIESFTLGAEKDKNTKVTTTPGGDKETTNIKSAIYAITRDGNSEVIYGSEDLMAYDAVLRDDGSIVVAAGPKGRLLLVDPAKQVTVVSDTPDEDLSCLLNAGDSTYIGSSNQGKVYKLQTKQAQEGTFESGMLDAKIVSSWGKISWRVANSRNTGIVLSTRTGNTEKVDNSWSEWSSPYTEPDQQITSPRARYLQWRAIFKAGSGPADVLDGVKIAYLQQNLRPQVVSIDVLPYGLELQEQPSLSMGMTMTTPVALPDGRSLNSPRERGKDLQPLPPRQVLQPGAQSFSWKASDDNDDSLEYSLYFKGEGESDWKLFEKKIKNTFYAMSAASLPDGVYRLKVAASDGPSNPYDRFLIGELVSRPFVIANASPKLEITGQKVNGKKVEAQFRASVITGRIATAEFSIDGGAWNLVFPVDGIADSFQEDYRITSPELPSGEHLLGIRTSDADGNTGTVKIVFRIQ